jgi:hypothetical protein
MSAPDFKQLLAKPLDDVKRPPAPPAGTYFGAISAFKFQESAWTNNDTGERDAQVRYTIRNVEPGPDILPELLAEIDLTKRQLNADLPLSGGNEWVTKTFLESLGVATAGRGFGEACPEAVGHAVMVDIVHRLNKNDPTAPPFTDVRNLRARPA